MNINNETFLKAYNCLKDANILLENGLGNFSELGVGALSLIKKMSVKNSTRLDFMNNECSKLGNNMYTTIQILSKIDREAAIYFDNVLMGEFNDEFGDFTSTLNDGNLKPKNNSDIAHRGYRGVENTAEAFRNAGKKGFWGCEADIRFDKDGNVVCSHDTVDGNEKPTTFSEYLDICKEYGMTAIIDLKYEVDNKDKFYALSPEVIKIIEEKGMMDSCILQTNMYKDVSNIRAASNDARIWYLSNEVSDKTVNLIEENNVECLNLKLNGNSTEQIARLNKLTEQNVDVCVWNVQSEETKNRLLKKGATYVMSDNDLGVTPYQYGEEDFNAMKGNYKGTTLINYGEYDEDAFLLPETDVDNNSESDVEIPSVLLAETGDKSGDKDLTKNTSGFYDGKVITAPAGRIRYTRTDGVLVEESWCGINLKTSKELADFYKYDGNKVVEGVKISDMKYWIREEDGAQMIGDYVAVAADVIPRSVYGIDDNMAGWDGKTYNYGDVVETTLGKGIVVGVCSEAVTRRKINGDNFTNLEVYTLWNTPGISGMVRDKDYVPTNFAHDPKLENGGVAVIKASPTYELGNTLN